MRTAVSISDELLSAAKRRARERGQTLGSVIEDALRKALSAEEPRGERPRAPVFTGGNGARPGVDLTSNRTLHEVLDEGVGALR